MNNKTKKKKKKWRDFVNIFCVVAKVLQIDNNNKIAKRRGGFLLQKMMKTLPLLVRS